MEVSTYRYFFKVSPSSILYGGINSLIFCHDLVEFLIWLENVFFMVLDNIVMIW